MKEVEIRPYLPRDRDACLAVFDSNAPEFFTVGQRPAFEDFLDGTDLDGTTRAYFVMEQDGAILGCGGYVLGNADAHLMWGMIHRDWHKRGLGRLLLMFRLREIGKAGAAMVRVEAPTRIAPFFERLGLKTVRAAGPGHVEMAMKLNVCP